MLANSEVPHDLKSAGNDALRAGIEADKIRHKVVHEWRVEQMDADDRNAAPYQRLRASKETIGYKSEPADLAFMNEAEDTLRIDPGPGARVRRVACHVPRRRVSRWPRRRGRPAPAPGEFTILPDGGWRIVGPPDHG
jgi:hypothetical protein